MFEAQLPASLTGAEFLQAYGEHYDQETQVRTIMWIIV